MQVYTGLLVLEGLAVLAWALLGQFHHRARPADLSLVGQTEGIFANCFNYLQGWNHLISDIFCKRISGLDTKYLIANC